MHSLSLALLVGLASLTVSALPSSHKGHAHHASAAPVVQEVHVFPVNTSVENLAVRHSGEILATLNSAPELYQIDPFCDNAATVLVHEFEGYTSLFGIVELEKDHFYIAAGNFSVFTIQAVPGWWAIFHVDMSSFHTGQDGSIQSLAVVEKVVEIPEGEFLNGAGVFSAEDGLMYVADSGSGIIYLVDVLRRDYWAAIQDPLTIKGQPMPDYPSVNGVHYNAASQTVFFSNVAQELYGRVPVFSNGSQAGAAEVVLQGDLYDDFLLDEAGNAFITLLAGDGVILVDAGSGESTVISHSSELEAPSAVARGRAAHDWHSLYVSRNGGIGRPTVVGGGVVRIDL